MQNGIRLVGSDYGICERTRFALSLSTVPGIAFWIRILGGL